MHGSTHTPFARLALPDGSVFRGRAFGACREPRTLAAEVVFNTAMCGYQEAISDPSYTGQILVMTAPMMGNYGANADDFESSKAQVSGFVVRELADLHSNQRATAGLDEWLRDQGVLGLADIDTRAVTRMLRVTGVRPGVLSNDPALSDADLVSRARSAPTMDGQNLVPFVSCASRVTWSQTMGEWKPRNAGDPAGGRRFRVLALDCGAKRNILRNLAERGCEVMVTPFDTPAAVIRGMFDRGEMDGLFISNGPGDPAAVGAVIGTLRDLLTGPPERTPPTFGICLGHQLLALALGAGTYKLKFGHRGANQPVRNLLTGRVEITSQNHGFAVDEESLRRVGGEPTHINLNDGTLAGFRLADRPVFAVQHHPEAGPGPNDATYLFDAFVRMMERRVAVDAASMKPVWGGPRESGTGRPRLAATASAGS